MPKADKKPRGDSPLNRLGAERQQAIVDHAGAHTLAETVKWLRDDGVITSSTALSDWLSSFRLGAQMRRNESAVERLMRDLSKEHPEWTIEQLQKVGQAFFTSLAVEQQDPKGWFLAQQLALKEKQLEFDQQRYKEALRSKIQAGLEAVAEAFRGNTQAMALYRQARDLVAKEIQ